MRLLAVVSLALGLGPSPLVLALSRRPGPLLAAIGLRQPPIDSPAKTPEASKVPNNKSKFVGVCWHRPTKKWLAQITIDRKQQHLGYFDSEEDAARAFDEQAATLRRPVNFPGPGQAPAVKRGAHGIVSRYKGVSWRIREKKWQTQITIDGKQSHVGFYASEEGAARAYDERAGPLGLPVNFPLEEGQEQAEKRGASKYEGVHWNFDEQLWEAVGFGHGERLPLGTFKSEEAAARAVDDHLVDLGLTRKHFPEEGELRQASVEKASKFVGVYRRPYSKRWFAKINIDGKTDNLGTFDSEIEAARAFDKRAAALGKPVNFPNEGQEQAAKQRSSKHRGVYKVRKKWLAQIGIDGKVKYLGKFDSEEVAARKFDEAAAPLGRAVNFPISMEKART